MLSTGKRPSRGLLQILWKLLQNFVDRLCAWSSSSVGCRPLVDWDWSCIWLRVWLSFSLISLSLSSGDTWSSLSSCSCRGWVEDRPAAELETKVRELPGDGPHYRAFSLLKAKCLYSVLIVKALSSRCAVWALWKLWGPSFQALTRSSEHCQQVILCW